MLTELLLRTFLPKRESMKLTWEESSAADARGLFALYLIDRGKLVEAFQVVKDGLSKANENPYMRMAGHQLFSRLPKSQQMTLLLYRDNKEPLSFGVAGLEGVGILFKRNTGQGYNRTRSGLEMDSNYSPIGVLTLKELAKDVNSGKLKLARTLSGKKSTTWIGGLGFRISYRMCFSAMNPKNKTINAHD